MEKRAFTFNAGARWRLSVRTCVYPFKFVIFYTLYVHNRYWNLHSRALLICVIKLFVFNAFLWMYSDIFIKYCCVSLYFVFCIHMASNSFNFLYTYTCVYVYIEYYFLSALIRLKNFNFKNKKKTKAMQLTFGNKNLIIYIPLWNATFAQTIRVVLCYYNNNNE